MTVRMSLLAILDQGPCYGYQLRAEFERRTGGIRPLNVGQIYNTLDRLERDGLVVKTETDRQGHVYYEITADGRAQAHSWLLSPLAHLSGQADELTLKLALAATLPGRELTEIVRAQREAAHASLDRLRRARFAGHEEGATAGEELAWRLTTDAQICRIEAELRFLDLVDDRTSRHPDPTLPLESGGERPRRGRPPKAAPLTRARAAAR